MKQALLVCGILMSLTGVSIAGDRIYGFLQLYERAFVTMFHNYPQMVMDEMRCSTCNTLTKRLEFFVSNMARACKGPLPDVLSPYDEERFLNLTLEFFYSFIVYRAPLLNEFVDKALMECEPDYSVLPPESSTFGWPQLQEVMHWFIKRNPDRSAELDERMLQMDEVIGRTSLSFEKKRDTRDLFYHIIRDMNQYFVRIAAGWG